MTAIFAEDDVPDGQRAFSSLNAEWFSVDKAAVRARVDELYSSSVA